MRQLFGSPAVSRSTGFLMCCAASPNVLLSPAIDLRVIAREQYVGHRPAAELRRPGVVRVLKLSAELGRERLQLPRALRERTRQAARDRIDEHHRRQVAVREYVWADRDRV